MFKSSNISIALLSAVYALTLAVPSATVEATSGLPLPEHQRFKVEHIDGNKAWYTFQPKSEKKSLAKGEFLTVGSTIFTGAATTVRMSLPDGSIIKVGSNTTFQITEVEGTTNVWQWTFQLLNGTVRALIRKAASSMGTSSKVRIKTPSGTAGVRGTEYVVSYSDVTKETRVLVEEGTVWLGPVDVNDYDDKNVAIELLTKGYCSKISITEPADPAQPCGVDYIPDAKATGVFSESLEFVPSRLLRANAQASSTGSERRGHKNRSGEGVSKGGFGTMADGSGSASAREKSIQGESAPSARDQKRTALKNIKTFSRVLLKAAKMGDLGLAQQALASGALIDVTDEDGNTPLLIATAGNHRLLVFEFVSRGANVNWQNKAGETALMIAAGNSNLDTVLSLSHGNPDYTLKNNAGQTAEAIAETIQNERGPNVYRKLRELRREKAKGQN